VTDGSLTSGISHILAVVPVWAFSTHVTALLTGFLSYRAWQVGTVNCIYDVDPHRPEYIHIHDLEIWRYFKFVSCSHFDIYQTDKFLKFFHLQAWIWCPCHCRDWWRKNSGTRRFGCIWHGHSSGEAGVVHSPCRYQATPVLAHHSRCGHKYTGEQCCDKLVCKDFLRWCSKTYFILVTYMFFY